MQWSKVVAGLECLQHLGGEQGRCAELLAAVYHTVAHCINLLNGFYNAVLVACQQVDDKAHACCVLGDCSGDGLFLAVGQCELYERTLETYLLNTSFCNNLF